MTAPASAAVSGDRALLERVLIETRARTDMPGPAWSDYLRSAAGAFADWLADTLRPLSALLHVAPGILQALAWLILACAAAVLVLLLARVAARWRRPTSATLPAAVELVTPTWPAESWAKELERRLAAGRARAALEALWWWLARSLAGPTVESSWTTRELLRSARRNDLGALGRALDRQLYGAGEPALQDVRVLAARVRAALQ